MTEADIAEFIRQTEDDLKIAKSFLAMWKRRESLPSVMSASQTAQMQLGQELAGARNGKPEDNGAEYGATKRRIVEAISKCPLEYTYRDVEQALIGLGHPLKRPMIQQGLSRLRSQKAITLLKAAAGPNPAIYKRY